jgi:hypothetical protein
MNLENSFVKRGLIYEQFYVCACFDLCKILA